MFPGDLQAREAAASKNCLKSSARWTIMMATLHKAHRALPCILVHGRSQP